MRRIKITTTRWRSPGALRRQRLTELLGKKHLATILGTDFVNGLESRLNLLEDRGIKLLAWQLPLLLLLVLAAVKLDVGVVFFGISADSLQGLREFLLVVSTTLGLLFLPTAVASQSVKEMLEAVIAKTSGNNEDLNDFLSVRYGISEWFSLKSYSETLEHTPYQICIAIMLLFAVVVMVLMLIVMIFAVHLANLIDVYRLPNFSPTISLVVMSYVILGDLVIVGGVFLYYMWQPYLTYEDAEKLLRLLKSDSPEGKKIIREIVDKYYSKSWIRRIFSRPKLSRLP